MKISNNTIFKKNSIIEKKFLDKTRFKRERYFYNIFKNKKLNIPKVVYFKKNKIIFKKYEFRKINSQKKFFFELLKFLVKINKVKNYKIHAKERLKSYKDLKRQVLTRYNKFKKINFEKCYLKKSDQINFFLKDIIDKSPKDIKLEISKKIISQSDIGFHNCALHKKKVFFYDFEYSGLDNPIKLICDVYYQPEKKISKKMMIKFVKEFQKEFNFKLPDNFYIFEKLYRAKMIMIILNIFFKNSKKFYSKLSSNINLQKLQLERLNKAYRYIKTEYLYE